MLTILRSFLGLGWRSLGLRLRNAIHETRVPFVRVRLRFTPRLGELDSPLAFSSCKNLKYLAPIGSSSGLSSLNLSVVRVDGQQ